MKKILVLTLLMISSFFTISQNVEAYTTDTEDRYEKQYSLCNGTLGTFCDTAENGSDYLVNGQINSDTNPLLITENDYTEVTFKLANIFSNMTPDEGYEVYSIQLKITVGLHYESNNVVYSSTDTALRKETYTYQVGDTSDNYIGTAFVLDIDPNNYTNFTEYVSSFTYTKAEGVTLSYSPKVSGKVIVIYTKTLDNYDNVTNVAGDYSLLPNTQGAFIDIVTADEYDSSNHSYKFSYTIGSNVYQFNVAVPEEIYDHVYSSKWQEVIHFEDIPARQMSIGTSPNGDQVLYIQPDPVSSNKPIFLENGTEPDVFGFITINLTTMEYKIIHKLQLVGVVNKESNRYATLYCFFPTRVENLLSITVDYQYRINSLIATGDWQEVTNTYTAGDSYDGDVPSWMFWVPAYGWAYYAAEYISGSDKYDIPNVIVPIEKNDVPDIVENKYVNELGGDENDLYSLNLYKVTLGQFQDGIFTHFSDEKAYDIQELVILKLLYEYNGRVYEASSEQIDSIVSTPELSTGFLEFGKPSFFDSDNFKGNEIIWGIVFVVDIIVILKSNFRRDKWFLLIFALIELYILYKMGLI